MSVIVLRNVSKTFPNRNHPAVENLNLSVEEGTILTLIGPSGCGKTTTLRIIAGFEKPDRGSIDIRGRTVVSDTSWVPPERRGVGMVFQDYALFPHLTVEKNVAFGCSHMSRQERKERVREVLALVGLEGSGDRYPHELSGGQQQRVALARALAPRPHVILLDEPFSNLDVHLRAHMRREIREIIRRAGITAIFVTHDQKDALAISDQIAVMRDGRLLQCGSPQEVYRNPVNAFVAQFLGKTNLLRARVGKKGYSTEIGEVPCSGDPPVDHGEVLLSIRPEVCFLDENGSFSGRVKEVEYNGEYQEVLVAMRDGRKEMRIYVDSHREVRENQQIRFSILPDRIAVLPQ